MDHVDTAFMQQIVHIAKGQPKRDVWHHREADNIGRNFEATE